MEGKMDSDALLHVKVLLNQIEKENEQCAFWIISAFHKLKYEHPKMSMICLFNILTSEMPKAAKAYVEYIRNT